MKLEISDIADASDPGHAQAFRLARGVTRHGSTEVFLEGLGQLGRQPSDIMAQISYLRYKNVRIFLKSNKISRAPIDRSVPALLMALSALERRETSKRNSEAVQDARARGSSLGRPLVMTPERRALAIRMLKQGKRGPPILKVIRQLGGGNISQSAYYLWQKAWLAGKHDGTRQQ